MRLKRVILLVALSLLLFGCAPVFEVLDAAVSVLDIFIPEEQEPAPVCNAKSVGVNYEGQTCLGFSYESYGRYAPSETRGGNDSFTDFDGRPR